MFFKIVKPTDIFRMTSQDLAALVTLSSAVPVFLVLPCFHSYHPPFCAKSKPAPSVKMMPQHAPALSKLILPAGTIFQKLILPGRVCLQDRPLGNMLRFCKWSDLTLPVEDVEIKSSQQSVQKFVA